MSMTSRAVASKERPGGMRPRSLLLLLVTAMHVWGLSPTVASAVSAGEVQTPHPYNGPVVQAEGGPRLAPGGLRTIPSADVLSAVPNQVPETTGADSQRRFVPGEIVVQFKPRVEALGRASVLRTLDASTKHKLPLLPRVQLVRISEETVPEAIAAFERQPQVLYAEPNFIQTIDTTSNDPLFSNMWGLKNTGQRIFGVPGTPDADIDAPEAWRLTTGSDSVTVGIVDTGVAYDHPDLSPNIWTNPGESGGGKETNGIDDDSNGFVDDWRGWDFVDGDNNPRDFNGHGTHVAGTIGAQGDNEQGVVGVNWDVGLMPVRTHNAGGSGTTVQSAEGFAYAGANGAKVVNASFGGPHFSMVELEAIKNYPNTLFVAGAGNEGADNQIEPLYPCAFEAPNIVCVAATDQFDELAYFSNFGEDSVDLGAPGTNVLSTVPAYGFPVFSDGFESPIGATWTTGGTNDSWARTEEASSGGSRSLTDSPGGEYLNDTDSFARTASPFSLAGQSGCRLKRRLKLSAKSGDGVVTEASTTSSFTAPTTIRTPRSTGSTGSFVGVSWSLSALDGAPEVFIRFRLESDSSITDDGVYIDDVEVRCLTSTFAGNEFEYLDGTSMATPHVSGGAALIWAETPGASVTDVKNALLSTTEAKASLAGKTVTGGRLNANLAVGGDPFEEPLEEEEGEEERGGKGDGDSGAVGVTGDGGVDLGGRAAGGGVARHRIARRGIANAMAVARFKGGEALLRLACRGVGACRGALRLVARVKAGVRKGARASRKRVRSLVVGRSGFSIPAGRTRTIRVRLRRNGKRLLQRAGSRGLSVRVRGSGVKPRTLKLKPKRQPRARRKKGRRRS